MVTIGRSAEDVGPAAGMNVGEPSWGRTPVEEEEGRLDRGKSWTTVQSSWKPRPTLRGLLKTTLCLRVDPSSGERTGLFYPQTDQSLSVGSLTRGWHAVGWGNPWGWPTAEDCLRRTLPAAGEMSPSFLTGNWHGWHVTVFIIICHISPNNRGSIGHHLSTRVSPTDFCEKVFLWNIIQESVPRCIII